MPEMKYLFQGSSLEAHYEEKFVNENIRTFVVTLPNGKQAFIKHMKATNISGEMWRQEPYTEHEIWPASLLKAITDALKLNFA